MPEQEELGHLPDEKEPGFKWTLKRRRFVYHFARTGKQAESAQKAGFTHPQQEAHALLKFEPIRRAINNEIKKLLRTEEVDEEYVISKWKNIADADITDYFEISEHGLLVLKDITEMKEDLRKRVKKLKITPGKYGTTYEIELHDMMRALDRLAEITGLIGNSQIEHKDPTDLADKVRQFLEQANEADNADAEQVH